MDQDWNGYTPRESAARDVGTIVTLLATALVIGLLLAAWAVA